mgnify:CR=1 FL=1
MTLRDVKVDQTVSVVKLHGEGASNKTKNYGYGNHKRNQHLCP